MKIIIVSVEQENYKVELEMLQCIYNNQTEKFEVPYVAVDNFTQYICPYSIKPTSISLSQDQAYIIVNNLKDVTLLSEWLRDADKKAKESFSKMAG